MNENAQKARLLLESGNYTCVLCNGETVVSDTRRGIRPLLELLERSPAWQGYSAADKVVGKAAAYMYRLLGVDSVYAQVISQPAAEVLQQCGIALSYGSLVSAIRNRDNTGFCPMETAVLSINDPTEALAAVKKALSALEGEIK